MARCVVVALKNAILAFPNAVIAMITLFIMDPPRAWAKVDASNLDRYPSLAYWNGGIDEESFSSQFLCAFPYAVFGGIHCIAWNFAPYSKVLTGLWRAASVAVAAIPLVLPFLLPLWDYITALTFTVTVTLCTLFIPARIILLILPFLELAHLPADTFKTVSWDDFLPHIG